MEVVGLILVGFFCFYFLFLVLQIVLKQWAKTLLIYVLVFTILQTGVNSYHTFPTSSRKLLGRFCSFWPNHADAYLHWQRQQVAFSFRRWFTRSPDQIWNRAIKQLLSREAIWILEFCWISQTTAACIWHLLQFFEQPGFFFSLAISRLSFIGLCTYLLSLYEGSFLNGVAIYITRWAAESWFFSTAAFKNQMLL